MKRPSWYKRILFSCCKIFRPHQRGPVKQFFSFGMAAVALSVGTFAFLQHSSENNVVTISSSSDVVLVGEPFYIDVHVRAVDDINAVDLEISYPEPRLSIDNFRTGESVLSIWTHEPTAINGQISLSGGTFRRGFSGEHRIIRLGATAVESGNIDLTFTKTNLIEGDGDGSQIALQDIETQELSLRAVSRDEAAAEGLAPERSQTDIRTDLTGDGRVTMADISMFLAAWVDGDTIYDFTGDGHMTFRDFSIILADYFRFR